MRHAPRAPTALCALVAAGLRGGGDVVAPPIGQPSERSISAQSRLQIRERCWRRRRSQLRRQQLPLLSNVPRSDARVLGPPCTTKAPPGARRPDRWHPLRTTAGAPTTAVAPPLMEGRHRCRRAAGGRGTGGGLGGPPPPLGAPGQRRGSLRRHGFERGCLASSGAGGDHSEPLFFFLLSKIRAN